MKRLLCVMLGIMLILGMSGGVLAQDKVVIEATVDTTIGYFYNAALTFKDYVEAASGGEVEVVIHSLEAIGSPREVAELINMGEYHMTLHKHEAGLAGLIPELQVLSLPFLVDDQIVGEQLFYGPYFDVVADLFQQKSNLRLLGVGKNSMRRAYFSKPIRVPSDIREQGLKMRTMEIPLHIAIWESLGCEVVTVPGPERYMAMQTGMMEGLEGGVASTRDAGVFPLVTDIVLTDHLMSFSFWAANDPWFRSLPENVQSIVAAGVEVATWEQRGLASQQTQEVLRSLGNEFPHITLHVLTPEELAQWRELATPPALEYIKERIGEEFLQVTLEHVEEASRIVSERRERALR